MTLEEELRELLDNDQKIAAIRLYRERTSAGLAEAKLAVEAVEQNESFSTADREPPEKVNE